MASAVVTHVQGGVQNRAVIRVPRSDILDTLGAKPTLKPEIRRRLDDIASQTFAHIAVVNSPLALSTRSLPDGISTSAGWSGLETERVCELVITGQGDSVELARVRLLVMLDELVRCASHSIMDVSHHWHFLPERSSRRILRARPQIASPDLREEA